MLLKDLQIRECRLFTYVIGSADVWFSAVNERTLYLRNDPTLGPVIRGEICDFSPECHVGLGQVLLEYALSCEGCQEQDNAGELVACVGERLGRILATRLFQDAPDLPEIDRITGAFTFLLQSLEAQAHMEVTASGIRYTLARCPLEQVAHDTGLLQGLAAARRGVIALCANLLHTAAPGWTLVQPTLADAGSPLRQLVLQPPQG